MALNQTASENPTMQLSTMNKPNTDILGEKQTPRGPLGENTGRCAEHRGGDKEHSRVDTRLEGRERNSEQSGPSIVEHEIQVAQRSASTGLDSCGRILGAKHTKNTRGLKIYEAEHEVTTRGLITSTPNEDPDSTSNPACGSSQSTEVPPAVSKDATTTSTSNEFTQSSNRREHNVTRMRALYLRCAPPEDSEEVTVGGAVYWSDDDEDKCSVCERDHERLNVDRETCVSCAHEDGSTDGSAGVNITRMRALYLRGAPPEDSEEVTVGGVVYWSDDEEDKCSVCERDHERWSVDSETCSACVREQQSDRGSAEDAQENFLAGEDERSEAVTVEPLEEQHAPLLSHANAVEYAAPLPSPRASQISRTKSTIASPLASPGLVREGGTRAPEDAPASSREGEIVRAAPTPAHSETCDAIGESVKGENSTSSNEQKSEDLEAPYSEGKGGQEKTVVVSPLAMSTVEPVTGASGETAEKGSCASVTHLKGTVTSSSEDASGNSESAGNSKRGDDTAPTTPRETPELNAVAHFTLKVQNVGRRWMNAANEKAALWGIPQSETCHKSQGRKRTWVEDKGKEDVEEMFRAVRQKID